MKPEINIIAAVCANGAIGRRGNLLFHLSDDLKRFKVLTMGWPIIMGRKTFESFPKGPLPGRRNVVISRNLDYAPEGAEVYASPEEALAACADAGKVFVIGGGEIYRRFMPQADVLLLTEIDASPADADTFFPAHSMTLSDASQWQGGEPRYRFATYLR